VSVQFSSVEKLAVLMQLAMATLLVSVMVTNSVLLSE
jgi:hypothetical protein